MQKQPHTQEIRSVTFSATAALASDEDAWYHHEATLYVSKTIRDWLNHRVIVYSESGNALADEEDAWARS